MHDWGNMFKIPKLSGTITYPAGFKISSSFIIYVLCFLFLEKDKISVGLNKCRTYCPARILL